MARFFETKEFKRLETQWNQILKETGFEDHEKLDKAGEHILKRSSLNTFPEGIPTSVVECRLHYYDRLSHYTRTHPFSSLRDRVIMQLASEGFTNTKIARKVSNQFKDPERYKNPESPIHRETVRFVIRRYEHLWGLRFWTLKQRNLKYEPQAA